jgi:DNA-binding transcriptional LysR family regulator
MAVDPGIIGGMNLRFLKTFVAVANQGNFARAANAVGLTQSAVSMQMRALENLLGVQLFDRTKRPAVISEQGEALVKRAREIVELYASLVKDVTGPDDLPTVLRLGAVRSTLCGIVPRALAALNRQFPGVCFSVVGGLPGDLIVKVEAGELDGAMVSEPLYLPPQTRWEPIMDEPMVVIAPSEAHGESAEELLTSYPYIGLNRGDWGSRVIDEYLNGRGIILRPILEFQNSEAVIMTVQRGLGVSILHQGCLDHPLQLMLRRVSLRDPPLTRRLGLLSRQVGQRTPLFDALRQELERLAAEQRDLWWPLGSDDPAAADKPAPRAKARSSRSAKR